MVIVGSRKAKGPAVDWLEGKALICFDEFAPFFPEPFALSNCVYESTKFGQHAVQTESLPVLKTTPDHRVLRV